MRMRTTPTWHCSAERCCRPLCRGLQVRLGPNGVEEILPIGPISAYEQAALDEAKELLGKNISAGERFAKSA